MAGYISPEDLIEKNIFEVLGINDISETQKTKLLDKIMAMLEARVSARVLDELNDEDLKAFEEISENDKETIVNFLKAKNLDLDKITAEETLILKLDIVNLFNATPEA